MTTEERSRQIIWLAYELLRTGKARGWSEAMKQAREQVDA